MDDLITPNDDYLSLTRNGTEESAYAEKIVVTFIRHKATQAVVNHDKTPYDIDTLYRRLRNVCCKQEFKTLVQVHKRNEQLILQRRKA